MQQNEKRLVHCTDYMPMYNKIPIDKRALAAKVSGFNSCTSFNQSKYMSSHYYAKFRKFYETISKDKMSPNRVGEPAEFDLEQLKHYYKELNNWIESEEYSMSKSKVKNRIVAEQNRISKLINNINQ